MKIQNVITVTALLMAGIVNATPIQWSSAIGGNDHYYEFVDDMFNLKTWAGAFNEAALRSYNGMNGYLATITSQSEQDFLNDVFSNVSSDGWIGGSDADEEGVWKWMAGPEAGMRISIEAGDGFGFSAWKSGEPNNNMGNEDYLVFGWTDDLWNDDNGSNKKAYLVEYSAPEQGGSGIPEPATLFLLSAGLISLEYQRRKVA